MSFGRFRLVVATLLGIALLASVGTPAAIAAPTREEYIAQVDPICQEADDDLRKMRHEHNQALGAGKLNKAARLLLRAVRRYETSITEVGAVEPPTEDAQLIAEFLALHRKVVDVNRKVAGALKREDRAAYRRLTSKEARIYEEIGNLISGYGFQHCA